MFRLEISNDWISNKKMKKAPKKVIKSSSGSSSRLQNEEEGYKYLYQIDIELMPNK